MMIVVDTNVLVYASNEDSPFHGACRHWLEQHVRHADAWYTTWPILYEFMRVVTHRRALSQPWSVQSAWNFVVALLAAPGLDVLVPTERHPDIAAQLFTELPQLSGNILHHAYTAVLMREHGIRQICTRDTDFHRFPFLEIIDPVQS